MVYVETPKRHFFNGLSPSLSDLEWNIKLKQWKWLNVVKISVPKV